MPEPRKLRRNDDRLPAQMLGSPHTLVHWEPAATQPAWMPTHRQGCNTFALSRAYPRPYCKSENVNSPCLSRFLSKETPSVAGKWDLFFVRETSFDAVPSGRSSVPVFQRPTTACSRLSDLRVWSGCRISRGRAAAGFRSTEKGESTARESSRYPVRSVVSQAGTSMVSRLGRSAGSAGNAPRTVCDSLPPNTQWTPGWGQPQHGGTSRRPPHSLPQFRECNQGGFP
jgi:hypothetical protein